MTETGHTNGDDDVARDAGRETFEQLVRRVVAQPLGDTQKAVGTMLATGLEPVGRRMSEMEDSLQSVRAALAKTLTENRRCDAAEHRAIHDDLRAARDAIDGLHGDVASLKVQHTSAEAGIAALVRRLSALYAILALSQAIILGLLTVLVLARR